MQEIRCFQCNKKLGNINGSYEIKCPRCGYLNTGGVRENQDNTAEGYRTVRPKDLILPQTE